jgi:diguanylate cyclase (GGDEF)-like protein
MTTLSKCPACGATSAGPRCASCGADLIAAPGEAAPRDLDRTASDREHTGSGHDQTASDWDQTWSDRDQSASDADQRSADEDQRASDADLAAGGDAQVHKRSARARDRAAEDRASASELRDETAVSRLTTAEARDQAADLRDREADRRDELARRDAARGETGIDDLLLRAERDRARAAADRAKAAEDRDRAARDRERAAEERAQALRIQSEAKAEIELAMKDELTGAWTRKFGLEAVSREIERAHRMADALVLVFVDVDGLKEVNDREGHLAGDALLRRVGETVRARVRPYDVVVRYGGDELVCAMPNIAVADARARFGTIATELAAADPHHSVTFGVAAAEPGEGLQALIARADADLLDARRRRASRA